MNSSFSDLINSCKRSLISADDMSFTNDTIHLPVKPMNGHNGTNNRIKSIIEQKKRNINSSIRVRTKIRKENNCTFCEQKSCKVTNCDRRISIGNNVDQNYLIQFMENSCPYKIAQENEIGTIIQSDKKIWKHVRHVKIHLIKYKINPDNKRPDKNYLFAIVTCYGVT